MNRPLARISAVCALALFAGAVAAQNTQPKPPLRGPAVRDGGVPGENRPFGTGTQRRKEAMGGETPHPVFVRAFNVLRGEDADAAVRLTPEQDARIKKIDEEFKTTAQAYRDKHAEEVKGLLGKLSPEDRRRAEQLIRRPEAGRPAARPDKGKRPEPATDDAMTPADPQASEAARERLRELFEQAPKATETHARMFGVLTDSQKPLVQKALDAAKAEGGKGKPGGKPGGAKPGQAKPGDDKPLTLDDPRLPERMRERIKNLPPEQRQEALRRAQERLRDRKPE